MIQPVEKPVRPVKTRIAQDRPDQRGLAAIEIGKHRESERADQPDPARDRGHHAHRRRRDPPFLDEERRDELHDGGFVDVERPAENADRQHGGVVAGPAVAGRHGCRRGGRRGRGGGAMSCFPSLRSRSPADCVTSLLSAAAMPSRHRSALRATARRVSRRGTRAPPSSPSPAARGAAGGRPCRSARPARRQSAWRTPAHRPAR